MLPGDILDVAKLANDTCVHCGSLLQAKDTVPVDKTRSVRLRVDRDVCKRCKACSKCFIDDAVVQRGINTSVMCPVCGHIEATDLETGDNDAVAKLVYVTHHRNKGNGRLVTGSTDTYAFRPDMLDVSNAARVLATAALAKIKLDPQILHSDNQPTGVQLKAALEKLDAAKEQVDQSSAEWKGLNIAQKLLQSRAICAGQAVNISEKPFVGRVHDMHMELSAEQVPAVRTFHRLFGEEK